MWNVFYVVDQYPRGNVLAESGKRSLQAAFLVSHFEGLPRGQQQILCFYLLCRVTSLGKDGCPIFPTTFLPLFLNCRS